MFSNGWEHAAADRSVGFMGGLSRKGLATATPTAVLLPSSQQQCVARQSLLYASPHPDTRLLLWLVNRVKSRRPAGGAHRERGSESRPPSANGPGARGKRRFRSWNGPRLERPERWRRFDPH